MIAQALWVRRGRRWVVPLFLDQGNILFRRSHRTLCNQGLMWPVLSSFLTTSRQQCPTLLVLLVDNVTEHSSTGNPYLRCASHIWLPAYT